MPCLTKSKVPIHCKDEKKNQPTKSCVCVCVCIRVLYIYINIYKRYIYKSYIYVSVCMGAVNVTYTHTTLTVVIYENLTVSKDFSQPLFRSYFQIYTVCLK